MRRAEAAFLLPALLALLAATAEAGGGISVPKVGSLVVVDAHLDLISEWNGSAVLAWRSALSPVEYDRLYILHNDTHYLFAAKLYDPDSVADDKLILYVNASDRLYKYVLEEDSSVVQAYNYSGGSWVPFTSAALFLSSRSHVLEPWMCAELAVPKAEWGNASSALMYIEHRSQHPLETVSRHPCDAGPEEQALWAGLTFAEPGPYDVHLELRDRDGETIEYVADRAWVDLKFPNGTLYTRLSLDNGTYVDAELPPGEYLVEVYVYLVRIYSEPLNVTGDYSETIRLVNLKREAADGGWLVAVLEEPSEILSIFIDAPRRYGMVIANSTEGADFYVFADAPWELVAVLGAVNFTYDPLTNVLHAVIHGGVSGLTLVMAPEGCPAFREATGAVKGYVCAEGRLEAWLEEGSYSVWGPSPPVAVVLDGAALRRGVDYEVDALNVTSLSSAAGALTIYYESPVAADVEPSHPDYVVLVATPYNFSGRIRVVLTRAGSSPAWGAERNALLHSPLTRQVVTLGGSEPGEYMVEVEVYDDDSGALVATASASFEIPAPAAAPARREVLLMERTDLALLALILALLAVSLAAVAIASRKRRRRRIVLEIG